MGIFDQFKKPGFFSAYTAPKPVAKPAAKPSFSSYANAGPSKLTNPEALKPKAAAKPVARAPVAKQSSTPSYSGGNETTSYSGGAVAAPVSAPVAAPAPVMEDVIIPDAAADTGYQKTVADLARTAVDFKAQQGLQRGQYDTQYGDAKRRMGWNEGGGANKLGAFDRSQPGAYGESVNANEGDFAGRGMYNSGAFGTSFGDINRDFGDRKTTLDTGRRDNVDTQNMALSGFTGQQDATKTAAMTDAVAKIAAQYGIALSDVPQGSTKTISRPVV